MGRTGRRLLGAALGVALCVALCACGTGAAVAGRQTEQQAGAAARPTQASPAQLAQDAAAVRALPAPDGVDSALWQQLSSALAQALAQQAGTTARPTGKARTASAPGQPPLGQAARVRLDYDPGTARLSWYCRAIGDYDQNGEVNGADLTPLAQRFAATSPAGAGQPWPEDALEYVLDGDSNGALNLADVTVIAQHWKERCEGYRIYRATDPALWPVQPDEANGAGSQLEGALLLSEAQGGGAFRLRFSYQLVPTATAQWYWVRPYSGTLDGAASLLSPEIVIVVPENKAPEARLAQPAPMGTAAHVVWDASQSLDPDGGVVKFEFDFGADGSYDETHELVDPDGPGGNPSFWTGGGGPGATGEAGTGDPAKADFWYYSPGSFSCRVRVTDNDGAQGVSVARTVEVSEVQKWRKNWVESSFFSGGTFGTNHKLFEVAGQPAVFSGFQNPLYPAVYCAASDGVGKDWHLPFSLTSAVGGEDVDWKDATIIAGRPALFGRQLVQTDPPLHRLVFIRANDSLGVSWPDVLTQVQEQAIETGGEGSYQFSLVSIAGRPAILGRDGVFTANDTLGSSWGPFRAYEGYLQPSHSEVRDLRLVSNIPCLPRRNSALDLLIFRIEGDGANVWTMPKFATSLENIGAAYGLENVNDKTSVFYFDSVMKVLRFRRAHDSEMSTWGPPINLEDKASEFFKFTVVAGRPAVLYCNRESGLNYIRIANDRCGNIWANAEVVNIGNVLAYLTKDSCAGSGSSIYSRSSMWFAGIGDSPALLCKEDDPATPQTDYRLRLAIYY